MGIKEKIAKLEALINSTKHAGERESAILARERLLKKLKGGARSKKSYRKKARKEKAAKDNHSESSQREQERIDPFFFREDVCIRSASDKRDATERQKDFICFLVKRGRLSCPEGKLENFLKQIGLKQACKIIQLLLEMFGEPKNDPLTDNQYFFLMSRREVFGLSEGLIDHLTVLEASKVIEAIKVIQEKTRV